MYRCQYAENGFYRPVFQKQNGHSQGEKKKKPPAVSGGGLDSILKSILPDNIDAGDLLLLAVLLLLYLDSKDEEFLIMLVVIGLAVFNIV